MNIVLSSGHGKYVRGASGYLDEVDEARRVVAKLSEILTSFNVEVATFNDDVSQTQDENLKRIVDFHNSKERALDISVHFNANETTSSPMGTECLYLSQDDIAGLVATTIAEASGLKDRGPKKRTDLYFLNNTEEPAILIEVCFVDSKADADIYNAHFTKICMAIVHALSGSQKGMIELLTIPPVTIYQTPDGRYVRMKSDLDICNDGSKVSHGDPSWQAETAYYSGGKTGSKYLNADFDKYIVIPPQVRSMTKGVVMGCKARLTNLETTASIATVCGEIGPTNKTGEAAYCAAKKVNPMITHNSGDGKLIYLFELWPDIPAVVDGFQYKLQPA